MTAATIRMPLAYPLPSRRVGDLDITFTEAARTDAGLTVTVMALNGTNRAVRSVALADDDSRRALAEVLAVDVDELDRALVEMAPEAEDRARQAPPPPDEWTAPVPFHRISLPAFPAEALSPWLREYVVSLAVALQVPADLPAMFAVGVLATVCAKKVEVWVRPDWREPLNQYVVVILDSGNRKSPVVSAMSEPLADWEEEQARLHGPEVAEAQTRRKILEASLAQAEAAAAKAPPDERKGKTAEAVSLARELSETAAPVVQRLVADETTPERLATLIRDHGARMAVLTAEGGDVFDIMTGRYSSGPNLGPFLKGHAGDTLRIDRVGRAPEYVRSPALTLGLTVQREVIRGLASQPTLRGRGVVARPLYAFPDSLLGRRVTVPAPLPESARAGYRAGVLGLLDLPWRTDEHGAKVPHALRLSDEAARVLERFMAWLEPQLGEYGELGSMTDWGGKLAGAVVRLAGLLHMADHYAGGAPWQRPIDGETFERAVRIGEYLIPHARATFAEMGTDPDVEAAKRVLGWIERNGRESFTKRDAFEGTKGHFKKVDALAAPLRLLAEHQFIRERPADAPTGPGRRPSPTYDVNPLYADLCANTANSALKGSPAEDVPEPPRLRRVL